MRGFALSGALFVGGYLYTRLRSVVMPDGLAFADALNHYRGTLEKRWNASRTYMWWYALPLAPAPIVIATGVALHAPEPMHVLVRSLIGLAVVGALLYAMSANARKKIQHRMDQLQELEEKA